MSRILDFKLLNLTFNLEKFPFLYRFFILNLNFKFQNSKSCQSINLRYPKQSGIIEEFSNEVPNSHFRNGEFSGEITKKWSRLFMIFLANCIKH